MFRGRSSSNTTGVNSRIASDGAMSSPEYVPFRVDRTLLLKKCICPPGPKSGRACAWDRVISACSWPISLGSSRPMPLTATQASAGSVRARSSDGRRPRSVRQEAAMIASALTALGG